MAGHDDTRTSAGPWGELCAQCGDRLGIYERLAVVRADGSVLHGGLLTLRDRLGEGARLFHAGCRPAG